MQVQKKTIDIIIPCHNEEPNIFSLASEIDRNITLTGYDYRLVFVDDGSTDNTCLKIRNLAERREDIRLIRLSRNFGKEAALAAGLRHCMADAAIIMDADLQHPPHLIPEMISAWEEGADIVDAVKTSRTENKMFRTLASSIFNGMFSRLTGIDFAGASDFKLLDKKAINILNEVNEKTRFFRGLTNWIGLAHSTIEFKVESRNAGKTKWNCLNLCQLSVDAVVSHSQKPLQIVTILGIFTLLFSLILGMQTLYNKFTGNAFSGFTTVIIVMLILASIIMICMGLLGVYLSKIYEEVKGRPICIIAESENFKKAEENP
jgi:dolichol-phosphate mannosyltransferase